MRNRAIQELIELSPNNARRAKARSELDALEADARALWSVRVLDAWRKRGVMRRWRMTEGISTSAPICRLSSDNNPHGSDYPGLDEDAARLAAALAVLPTLTDDVRADLGECP